VETSIKFVIEQGVSRLPPLPTAAMRIVEVVNDMSSSPKDLMEVIKIDPVMTGKILNLVNSSYFSMPQRITSLNRALILLGFNTIKNIALSTAFIDATNQHGNNSKIDDLWQHLLNVGVACKMIAVKCGQPRQILEEFFIAGLLHDIGDLILLRFAPQKTVELMDSSHDKSFELVCLENFQLSGPDCGLLMIDHWKLPQIFRDVVHHNTKAGKNASFVVNAVHIADKIVREQNFGLVTDSLNVQASLEQLQYIGLSQQDLKEIKEQLSQEVQKAQIFMSER
jgi:HD-like signal output (HDOD) protein